MKSFRLRWALGLCLAGAISPQWGFGQAATAAAAEELPRAETVLDRFVEATGGRAAYEAVFSERVRGTVEVVGLGLVGTIAVYTAAPAQSYSKIEMTGAGVVEEGTSGDVAWERSTVQGPRIKTGDERAAALREGAFNAHLRWRELYAKAEVTGTESVGERSCYKVVLTPAQGKPMTHFYDRETGLLLKVAMVQLNPMGEIPAEALLEDYREVRGIRMPHSIRQRALSQEYVIRVQSIEFNAALPEGIFDLPDDVRALLPR
ncbi:MAG: outer membrane lipoprotein-sorting protein [Acidobacteria bacterium]|nr:outer membrane lipoprotein-sorting protein [Acidobacteriota bacterium]